MARTSSPSTREWPHGCALRVFRFRTPFSGADQTHRSHSVCGHLTRPEFKMLSTLFRTIVCKRLRLPLQLTGSKCECGAALEKCGSHRGTCPRSGRLKSWATTPEKHWHACAARQEGRRTHVKLRDLNTSVPVVDDRSIKVLTFGLPMHHGAQLAMDITLKSPVTSFGAACLPTLTHHRNVTIHKWSQTELMTTQGPKPAYLWSPTTS